LPAFNRDSSIAASACFPSSAAKLGVFILSVAEHAKRKGGAVNPEPFLLRKSGQHFCNTSPLDLKAPAKTGTKSKTAPKKGAAKKTAPKTGSKTVKKTPKRPASKKSQTPQKGKGRPGKTASRKR
jgi:hypothetical protein